MNARKAELLARAQALIDSPSYSREDSARVDGLLRMADLCTDPDTRSEIEAGQKSAQRRSIMAEREESPRAVFLARSFHSNMICFSAAASELRSKFHCLLTKW